MSDFFPEPARPDEPVEDPPEPVWLSPPLDLLPGVVPVELIIGRSDQAVVMLTGVRAFPSGMAMNLAVRTRTRLWPLDLNDEVFDWPYRLDIDEHWSRDRLKWGFELADGRRATNVDPWPRDVDPASVPDRPVLSGGGGGGSERSVDRDYWLWPLPPAGPLKVVCQWLKLGIGPTVSTIDAELVVAAAGRAQPVWA